MKRYADIARLFYALSRKIRLFKRVRFRLGLAKNEKSIKFERRNRFFYGIFALFGLCLNEAAPLLLKKLGAVEYLSVGVSLILVRSTAAEYSDASDKIGYAGF